MKPSLQGRSERTM
ncbi:hypothetical protein F383_08140 [Gossypium arboreum]|uniref:Uncharacterized protein n=1 Tax=Gossypium arboreum TaxID=29729 RepID=A0A0B0NNY6_GOSAR|nr:hypothetical protein F383_08140 [Gossypium arboreum]